MTKEKRTGEREKNYQGVVVTEKKNNMKIHTKNNNRDRNDNNNTKVRLQKTIS